MADGIKEDGIILPVSLDTLGFDSDLERIRKRLIDVYETAAKLGKLPKLSFVASLGDIDKLLLREQRLDAIRRESNNPDRTQRLTAALQATRAEVERVTAAERTRANVSQQPKPQGSQLSNVAARSFAVTAGGSADVLTLVSALQKLQVEADTTNDAVVGVNATVAHMQQIFEAVGSSIGEKLRTVLSPDQITAFGDAANQVMDDLVAGSIDTGTAFERLGSLVRTSLKGALPADQVEAFAKTIDQSIVSAVENAGTHTKTLVQQLRNMRDELGKMNETDPGFEELSLQAAKLEHHIEATNQRLRILASPTKNIQALVGGVKALAVGFEVAQAGAALFGTKNEDLEKTLVRVQAAMAFVNGLEEISALLREESAVKTVLLKTATEAAAVAEEAFGVSAGVAMGVATAGISILIAGVAYLLLNWQKLFGAAETAQQKIERLKKEIEEQQKVGDVNNETLKEYKEALIAAGGSNNQLEIATKQANDELDRQKKVLEDIATFGREKKSAFDVFETFRTGADASALSVTELQDAITQLQKDTQNFTDDQVKGASFAKAAFDQGLISADKYTAELSKETAAAHALNDERKKIIALIQQEIDKRSKAAEGEIGSVTRLTAEVNELEKKLRDKNLEQGKVTLLTDQLAKKTDDLFAAQQRLNSAMGISIESVPALTANVKRLQDEFDNLSPSANNFIDKLNELDAAKAKLSATKAFIDIATGDVPEIKPQKVNVDLTIDLDKIDQRELDALNAALTDLTQKQLASLISEDERQRLSEEFTTASEVRRLNIRRKFLVEALDATKANLQLDLALHRGHDKELTDGIADLNSKILALDKELGEKRIKQINDINAAIILAITGIDITKLQETPKPKEEDKAKFIDYYSAISAAGVQAADQVLDAFIRSNEEQQRVQQRRVDKAAKIAEKGNAELLQKEEERMDRLEQKNRAFVQSQQAINTALAISNLVVAIAKAASQTGVGAPIAIASVIAAVGAAFAAVAGLGSAAGAGFEEGGYTGDGHKKDAAGTVHRREFVFTEKHTSEYRDIFEQIHAGKLNLRTVVEKAKSHDHATAPMNYEKMTTPIIINAAPQSNFARIEGKLDNVVDAINAKPVPRTTFDERGMRVRWLTTDQREQRARNLT